MLCLRIPLLVLATTLAITTWQPSFGQTPLGGEFQVNTKTDLHQGDARVAVDPDGTFAVAWVDSRGESAPFTPFVVLRFYDSQGRAFGEEVDSSEVLGEIKGQPMLMHRPPEGFRLLSLALESTGFLGLLVEDYSPRGELLREPVVNPPPDLTMLLTNAVRTPKDRVILSWITNQNHPANEVKTLKLSAGGQSFGKETSIALDPNGPLYIGDVGVDRRGIAIVVWSGECGQEGRAHCDVFAQRLAPSGEKLGVPVRINATGRGLQENVHVGVSPAGPFLAVWVSAPRFPGSSAADVFGQRFSAAGEKTGSEFRINTTREPITRNPAIASDPFGNYVVVWSSFRRENGAFGWDLLGQIFRRDGRRVGKEFRVNVRNTFNEVTEPRVAFGGNGTFVVVWNADDGSFDGVFGRRFAASAGDEACVQRGGELLCDTGRTGGEAELTLALPGGVVVLGDVDGDGRADPCVFANGLFQCDTDHQGEPYEVTFRFGRAGDTPLFGDVDGDGRDEPCVRRDRFHLCDTGRNGGAAETRFAIGAASDQPLLGDVDGDGRDDACVFDSRARFLCDIRHNGRRLLTLSFGQPGDLAVLGDFDGDGDDDPCVFRAGRLLCDTQHDGGAAEAELAFGQAGDRPLLGNLDGL